MSQGDIRQRKVDHIELCAREEVEFRLKRTLFNEVDFIHDSLPELNVAEIDMSTELIGKRLRAPIVITGMTGGAERARQINMLLARLADKHGVAFGVGSQRAMLVRPETSATYKVRDVAPNVVLFGNIGVVQARDMSTQAAQDLVGAIDADALCVHLNPAQELIQEDGDRDFLGCLDAIARLTQELSVPVIVKETGCGLSPSVVRRARAVGVKSFDLSGAGGTTWVGVEVLRAREGRREIGEDFWEWGIPTAASLLALKGEGAELIASGGVRSGLDVARAIALGASAAGMALPLLLAVERGGYEAAEAFLSRVVSGLQVAMLLTGCRNLAEMRDTPRIYGPALLRWVETLNKGQK